jgi:hypothetical protein
VGFNGAGNVIIRSGNIDVLKGRLSLNKLLLPKGSCTGFGWAWKKKIVGGCFTEILR